MSRKPYPSDVSDQEWNFAAPYLALIDEQAPQRCYSLREVFNTLRWLTRADAACRILPNDLSPRPVVYQQFRRWVKAGCFEGLVSDMRLVIRAALSSPAPLSWMAEPCKATARADRVRATTATNGARAPKYTWPWIRWAIS